MTNPPTSARLTRHSEAVAAHRRAYDARLGPVSRPAAMSSTFSVLSDVPEHAEWRRIADAHGEAAAERHAHAATRETAEALDEHARALAVSADPSAPLPPAEHVPAHEAAALEHDRRVAALERVEIDAFLAFIAAVRERAAELQRTYRASADGHRARLETLIDDIAAELVAIDRLESSAGVVRSVVEKDVDERKMANPIRMSTSFVDVGPVERGAPVGHYRAFNLLPALRDYRAPAPESPEPTEPPLGPDEVSIEVPDEVPEVSGPRRRAARIGIRRATSAEADAA